MKRLTILRMKYALIVILLFTQACALQKYLPDSYSSPDGKYKQNCVKDQAACTITCDVTIEGHKSKKTLPLEDCV